MPVGTCQNSISRQWYSHPGSSDFWSRSFLRQTRYVCVGGPDGLGFFSFFSFFFFLSHMKVSKHFLKECEILASMMLCDREFHSIAVRCIMKFLPFFLRLLLVSLIIIFVLKDTEKSFSVHLLYATHNGGMYHTPLIFFSFEAEVSNFFNCWW